MQQRASIARALAFDADILLMDEPFGALDEIVRDHLNEQLLRLWARTQKTIAFVTHSIPEAVYLSTKIVVMSPRPGRIADVIDSPLPKERPWTFAKRPSFWRSRIGCGKDCGRGMRMIDRAPVATRPFGEDFRTIWKQGARDEVELLACPDCGRGLVCAVVCGGGLAECGLDL